MSSDTPSKSLELRRTIAGQRDSLGRQQSHSLELSADVTTVTFTGTSKSAPNDVLPYQLLITVTATGELVINELSTFRGRLGLLSQINQEVEDSSESQSDLFMRWMTAHEILHDQQSSPSEHRPQERHLRSLTPRPSQWSWKEFEKFSEFMEKALKKDPSLTAFGAAYATYLHMKDLP